VIRKQGSRQSNNIFKYHVRSQPVSHNRAVDKQCHTQGHSVFADGTLSNDETAYGLESNQEISLAANVAAMRISVAYVKTEWPWCHTVDFHLSEHRDIGSAKEFFTQTIDKQGAQEKITLTVRQQRIPQLVSWRSPKIPRMNVLVQTSKYLKNLVEQD
jgi:hypothetical protein